MKLKDRTSFIGGNGELKHVYSVEQVRIDSSATCVEGDTPNSRGSLIASLWSP